MVRWTAELDSILLHGVFEECNISFNRKLCAKIAERVSKAGVECTAKAVEGRLYLWKKKNLTTAQGASTPGTNGQSSPAATRTPLSTKMKTPTSNPRVRAKPACASTKNKKRKLDSESEGGNSPEGFLTDEADYNESPSPCEKVKRKRGDEEGREEDLADFQVKKIKTEPVEEDEEVV